MIAPVVFLKQDSLRVCIDALDVCRVSETDIGNVCVEYMEGPKTKAQIFTSTKFYEVLETLKEAKAKVMGTDEDEDEGPEPGDEWKGGFDGGL